MKISLRSSLSKWSLASLLLASLLLVAVGGSYMHLRASQQRANQAWRDALECKDLLTQIAQIQATPVRAELQGRSEMELAKTIETAAAAARVPRNAIVRIDPGEPRRVAQTDYQSQPTEVELRPVNLKQLLTFLDAVSGNYGIDVGFLWLTWPSQAESRPSHNPEQWNAQLVLSNLIYAPRH